MSKLKIKRKTSKEINTKNGPTIKYSFLCTSETGGEQWVGAFSNQMSDSWNEGDVVENSLKSREYNGKLYYDFVFDRNTPRGAPQAIAGVDFGPVMEKLDYIISLLIADKPKENEYTDDEFADKETGNDLPF